MLVSRQRGVTLIELMIGLGIVAMLLAATAPSFNVWMQNSQNRAGAESILTGLSLARAEAVRRSKHVRFELREADGQVVWRVGCVVATTDCPETIQQFGPGEGRNARVGVSTDPPTSPLAAYYASTIAAGAELPAGITFDGLGRMPLGNAGSDITRIDVTNAVMADARRYVITIAAAGQARMCDPAFDFTKNMQGCN